MSLHTDISSPAFKPPFQSNRIINPYFLQENPLPLRQILMNLLSTLYDPEQNALWLVYRGQKTGIGREAEAAYPLRHDHPRSPQTAGNRFPVCCGVGHHYQKSCSCGQPQEVHTGAHHLDGR